MRPALIREVPIVELPARSVMIADSSIGILYSGTPASGSGKPVIDSRSLSVSSNARVSPGNSSYVNGVS